MTREELQPIIIRYLSDGKSVKTKFLADTIGVTQNIAPILFDMKDDGILSHIWIRVQGCAMWSLSPISMAVVDALCDPTDQPKGEAYPESKRCTPCFGTGRLRDDMGKCGECGGTGWAALGKHIGKKGGG